MKTLLALALVAAPLAAQQTPRSTDWRTRFDRAGAPDSALRIEQQATGWRFTTASNGSGIAWLPSMNAQGNFRVEAETMLYPGRGHREAYGLLLGGRGLEAPNQSYFYFLVRGDGQYMIRHRAGTETHDIVTWTPNAAIPRIDSSNVRILLGVDARSDSVAFLVNGTQVHALPRSQTDVNGIVGLRINHGLRVQVNSLNVARR